MDYADDDFNRVVLAVTAGFGVLHPAGPGPDSHVIEIRGKYCFQNLLNEDFYVTVLNQDVAMVMVGYRYQLR